MVYVFMGVAGCGKSTIGAMAARELGLPFYDADDFHPGENIEKMKRGVPLDDKDRAPWLERLSREIARWDREGGAVLACSALKEAYRNALASGGPAELLFVHLHGPVPVIRGRLESRPGHFFPPALLESQFHDMEIPERALSVPVDGKPDEVCRLVLEGIAGMRGTRREDSE